MANDQLMICIDNVSKEYRLGQIGGTTLREELQRKRAKWLHQEDPTKKIGAKSYEKSETFSALDQVSFEVRKGERIGIIGHNGAGKSTLLKLISRVTAPSGGMIGLNGRVASMLEVGTGFNGELTGRENIYMNGAILGMTKKEIDSKMDAIIEFSECRKFIDTPVKRYSSGMYVKLAFAVAAHLNSEIMIMDEVLAVGDAAFQKKCLDKMNQVSRDEGRTILYVSHNMNTIKELCDRCVVLDHGKKIFDGDVDEAIRLYSNINNEMSPCVDLTKVVRNVRNVPKPFAYMEKIEVVERNDVCFQASEKMRLKLTWVAKENIKNVRIRTIFRFSDMEPIGLSLSNETMSGEKGKRYTTFLEYDMHNFVNGIYKIGLFLTEIDPLGEVYNYDSIGTAFCFEVNNKEVPLVWVHRVWGHQYYPDMHIRTELLGE